jgi:putative ABC transport system ATP-binding protein
MSGADHGSRADVAYAARALQRLAEQLGMKCASGELERRLGQTRPDEGMAPIAGRDWLASAAEAQGLRTQRIDGPLDAAIVQLEMGQVVAAELTHASGIRHWVALLSHGGGTLRFARYGEGLAEHDAELDQRAFEAEYPRGASAWVALDLAMPNSGAAASRQEGAADHGPTHGPGPWARLRALLRPDRGEILSVAAFAVAIGVLQLATPIAVQALVNFVAMGGAIPPVIVVAGMLLLGLLLAGVLSAMQVWIVEVLQRRLFVRMVADLAARLPRVRDDDPHYGPELVNRFLEVATLQKLGATILLEGVALILSLFVGLTLLAFYHPWLLAFDVALVLCVMAIIFLPMRAAVRTAIDESKVKYETVAWLEEIARNPRTFKSAGAQQWIYERTDRLASDYVVKRKAHFRAIFGQTLGVLTLRALASTVLLVIGGLLVIRGELSLGQLVAAEIVVSLVVDATAKIDKNLEKFYAVMASTDKIGHLLDLPLEERSGEHHEAPEGARGATLQIQGVATERAGRALFSGLDVQLPAGASLCIRGPAGAGKSTLVQMLWGLRRPSTGAIRIDGRDVREISTDTLRAAVSIATGDEFLSAAVRDNVRLGRSSVRDDDVRAALNSVGLFEEVAALPDGLETELDGEGHPLSESQSRRLLLARAIVSRPRLLVIDGLVDLLPRDARRKVTENLLDPQRGWTLVLVSDDPELAASCSHVLELPTGLLRVNETKRPAGAV